MREIGKLWMFTVLWAFPIVLARMFENNSYLWFLSLSLLATMGMFSHYEDLEKIDNLKRIHDEKEKNDE